MNFLSEMEPWSAAALLVGAMISAWVAGWRVGRTQRAGGGEPPYTKLDDVGFALFGLLLAFTFSIALNKFDHRRARLVADTSAIGDFYTCASLLPEPTRTKLQDVVRDYTALRLQVASKGWNADLEGYLKRFAAMHTQMTALVGEALGAGTPIAVPLTNTLNELTSSHGERLAAVRDMLPGSILLLLISTAVLSSGLVGRQQGLAPRASILGTASFIAIVTLTIYVTLDLNHPARGLIQISQEPMQRLLDSMVR
jgi:hypothetical protein